MEVWQDSVEVGTHDVIKFHPSNHNLEVFSYITYGHFYY